MLEQERIGKWFGAVQEKIPPWKELAIALLSHSRAQSPPVGPAHKSQSTKASVVALPAVDLQLLSPAMKLPQEPATLWWSDSADAWRSSPKTLGGPRNLLYLTQALQIARGQAQGLAHLPDAGHVNHHGGSHASSDGYFDRYIWSLLSGCQPGQARRIHSEKHLRLDKQLALPIDACSDV